MSSDDWQPDMVFLTAMRDQMNDPAAPDRDGLNLAQGFRQYPKDPRWLVVLTWIALILTALSLVLILHSSMKG